MLSSLDNISVVIVQLNPHDERKFDEKEEPASPEEKAMRGNEKR